ncbi:outer membrane beta-barrel protein [Pseudoalteromonas sp. SaAl2]
MKYAVLAGALSLFSITAAANQISLLSYDYVEAGYTKTDIKSNDKTDPDSPMYSGYDGYVINLSKQLSENWYVTGSYSQSRVDYSSTTTFTPLPGGSNMTGSYHETTDMSLTRFNVGFGYIQLFSRETSVDYALKYGKSKVETEETFVQRLESDGNFFDVSKGYTERSETADSFEVTAQIRHLLTEQFEVNAGISYERLHGVGAGYVRLHDAESENNLLLKAGINYAVTDKITFAASYSYTDEYADIAAAAFRYYF